MTGNPSSKTGVTLYAAPSLLREAQPGDEEYLKVVVLATDHEAAMQEQANVQFRVRDRLHAELAEIHATPWFKELIAVKAERDRLRAALEPLAKELEDFEYHGRGYIPRKQAEWLRATALKAREALNEQPVETNESL